MSLYDNELWTNDIDEIIESLPELQELNGCKVLITGCTGLICSAIVDVLVRFNESKQGDIRILAAGRDVEIIERRFFPYSQKEWFSVKEYDATRESVSLDYDCDYIIHGASNASPDRIIKEPVETMMSNILGTKVLLDFAKKSKMKRFLLISSSEVYGEKEKNAPNRTDEYGYVDLLKPRSSYSVAKRAAETLCVSYSDEFGVDSVIVRPGHIYGPTARQTDKRVSSVWTYDVAKGHSITMKSEGKQIRSYCYCLDCASAIIIVLLKGQREMAYNISNSDSIISIREMAELLTTEFGKELIMDIPTDADVKGFNPMSNSSLDSTELEKLGWKGLFSARRGLSHTVGILKSMIAEEK